MIPWRSIGLLIVPCVLSAIAPAQSHAQRAAADPQAAVRQAALQFVDAFNNLDWPRFAASFDSTATIFHPMATFMRRIEGRDSLVESFKRIFRDTPNQRPGPPYLNIRPQDLLIQVVGDAAVVTFHLGAPPMLNRRTLVFVRRGDRWLIAHLHASVIQAVPDTTR